MTGWPGRAWTPARSARHIRGDGAADRSPRAAQQSKPERGLHRPSLPSDHCSATVGLRPERAGTFAIPDRDRDRDVEGPIGRLTLRVQKPKSIWSGEAIWRRRRRAGFPTGAGASSGKQRCTGSATRAAEPAPSAPPLAFALSLAGSAGGGDGAAHAAGLQDRSASPGFGFRGERNGALAFRLSFQAVNSLSHHPTRWGEIGTGAGKSPAFCIRQAVVRLMPAIGFTRFQVSRRSSGPPDAASPSRSPFMPTLQARRPPAPPRTSPRAVRASLVRRRTDQTRRRPRAAGGAPVRISVIWLSAHARRSPLG